MSTYDVVIRNGTVVDGSGFGSYRGDVAVSDGRIAAIGRVPESGATEIDAEEMVVTPGFIDGHTHMDAQVFWDPRGANSCWHGVTTAVMGNCGFTLAPVRDDERALVVRNLERAEDMDPAALAEGIPWSWETFPQYLDAVDALPKGINYAANIGHSALRTWAMGERAFSEAASPDDLAAMAGQLEAALLAGAIGFTTTRSAHHETSDDRPVASRIAEWDEVRALVDVMARLGVGILEGGAEGVLDADEDVRALALERVKTMAAETGVPITMGLLALRPLGWTLLEIMDEIGAAGGRMIGQTHCRGINVLLSFLTRLPFDVLPEWVDLRALPHDEQLRQLHDPARREQLAAIAMEGDYSRWRGVGAMPRKPEFDKIRVYRQGLPPNPTVAEVAAERAVSPAMAMIELAVETELAQLFIQPSLYPQDEEVLLDAMRHPRTVMTFSDSGAHLSQIADSSIHTHLLGYWVRDRQEFSIEEAVRMITLAPAQAWGFADRGLLREGLAADICIFDPATVGPDVPEIVHDLPAGAPRLSQRAVGFSAVLVNGQVTVRDGDHTDVTPGRLLRNRRAASNRSRS